MKESLNIINYVNVLAFLISWSLLVEDGRDRGPDDNNLWRGVNQLSKLYEGKDDYNSFTPAVFTFFLSHVVLLFQGIFTIVQLLPTFRSSPFVQDGVGLWYLGSAISTLIWSLLAFGIGGDDKRERGQDDEMPNISTAVMSVIFMALAASCFGKIVYNQANKITSSDTDVKDECFWMIQLPFSLSFGWFFALFFIDLNDMIYSLGVGNAIMLTVGIVSLVIFVVVGLIMVNFNYFDSMGRPNYIIPSVFAWLALGIALGQEQGDDKNNDDGDDDFNPVNIVATVVFMSIIVVLGVSYYKVHILDIEKEEEDEYTNKANLL